MSNPHSPEPSRWILEMFAPDIPPWYRAFNELERKPLNALEDTLVHSFDRYLRRKGYLTKRQVEVLENIARKHNVLLPLIPPTAHHSESFTTDEIITATLLVTEGYSSCSTLTKRTDKTYTYRRPYIRITMCDREALEPAARVFRNPIAKHKEKEIKCPPHLYPPNGKGRWYVTTLGRRAEAITQKLKPLLTKEFLRKWEQTKKRCPL